MDFYKNLACAIGILALAGIVVYFAAFEGLLPLRVLYALFAAATVAGAVVLVTTREARDE